MARAKKLTEQELLRQLSKKFGPNVLIVKDRRAGWITISSGPPGWTLSKLKIMVKKWERK